MALIEAIQSALQEQLACRNIVGPVGVGGMPMAVVNAAVLADALQLPAASRTCTSMMYYVEATRPVCVPVSTLPTMVQFELENTVGLNR